MTVPDGDGVASRVVTPPEQPVDVQPHQEKRVELCVRIGRVHGYVKVDWQAGDQITVEKTFEASPSPGVNHFAPAVELRQVIVGLGSVAKTLEDAATLGNWPAARRPVVAKLDDLAHLPTHWYGYEGVDALVLSTGDPDLWRSLAPGSPQLEALDQWVRMGGRLVLCAVRRQRRRLPPIRPWLASHRAGCKRWFRCGRPARWRSIAAARWQSHSRASATRRRGACRD